MPPHPAFVAGTPVLTEDGDKPIEDVTVGDYVWAWDEATGTTELKQVVEILCKRDE